MKGVVVVLGGSSHAAFLDLGLTAQEVSEPEDDGEGKGESGGQYYHSFIGSSSYQ